MKIIAIEGLDKSGKATAAAYISEYLKTLNYKVYQSEFHRYDTPTGKLIQEFLTEKNNYSQPTIELIMAADKQAQQDFFDQLEEEGYDYLVLDRYTTSQIVYSVSLGIDLDFARYLQFYMRQPDYEILLDIPPEVSMNRKGKHNNGVNDKYESDIELLSMVRFNYLYTLKENDSIYRIDANCSIELMLESLQEILSNKILQK